MGLIFSPEAQIDREYWKRNGNRAVRAKISSLLASINQTPFEGIGKPEPLKYDLAGKWSRRIDRKHRITYSVYGEDVTIHSLRDHYRKR
jgi:toxin YoeB